MIRVAVLASSPMARARLEALLAARPGLRLVSNPRGSPGVQNEADVIVVDPGGRRADEVLDALAPEPRRPPIVLLAGAAATALSPRLVRAGVRAVLPGDASAAEAAAAIEAAAVGLVVLHTSAVAALSARGSRGSPGDEGRGGAPLTAREIEVLAMMAEGMGNRAIAGRLGISTHTVKFHVAAVLDKLNARSRAEAVAVAMRLGLLMV